MTNSMKLVSIFALMWFLPSSSVPQIIPYRLLWNQTKVGQARVTFDLYPAYLESMKVFSVRMMQAAGTEAQEAEIML